MKDARLGELRFLTKLQRDGLIELKQKDASDPEAKIAIHLLAVGLVNDATATTSGTYHEFEVNPGAHGYPQHYRDRLETERWKAIARIYQKQPVDIRATHAAAVRRAELEQSIQRDRLKDSTGILFDGRYADRDLQIALWAVTREEPLSFAFLDMNGLKTINDSVGHEAGDEAIRIYLGVIADVLAEVGDAYRIGGDEVVIILPKKSLEESVELLRLILRGLNGHTIVRNGRSFQLSASAGITSTDNAGGTSKRIRARADEIQYKAKDHSKAGPSRIGTLAIDGNDIIEEFVSK